MTQALFIAMKESMKATGPRRKPMYQQIAVPPRIRQIAPSPLTLFLLQRLYSAASPLKQQIGERLAMKEHAIGCKCLESIQPMLPSSSSLRLIPQATAAIDWEIPRSEDRQFRVDRVISYLNK
ncbi:MAG: hypothetical protein RLZZ453_89 [Chlamydiota bacterium]|jgi:hypothetical protein